jgi:RHS repeat-associated protein
LITGLNTKKNTYAFGMPMPGRNYQSSNSYRYGMNGQEKDLEIFEGAMTAEYWEYDPRIGRRWNTDPLSYPWQSPYVCFNNNPIIFVDPLGLFGSRKEAREYKKENNLSGRVRKGDDGVFSIDDRKAGTSTFKDAEFGITKAALVEATRSDNKTLTPWQLGTEWLSGKGARSRDFIAGDNITEMYKKHEHVDQTRQMAINQLANSNGTNLEPGNNPYSLGGVEGVGKYLKDYSTLATAGLTGNLIYTYLGSHSLQYTVNSVDVEKRIAIVTFMATNMSTIQSATRPPVLGYTEFYKNNIGPKVDAMFSNGPMSETEQSIQWTETIKY